MNVEVLRLSPAQAQLFADMRASGELLSVYRDKRNMRGGWGRQQFYWRGEPIRSEPPQALIRRGLLIETGEPQEYAGGEVAYYKTKGDLCFPVNASTDSPRVIVSLSE